MPDIDGGFLLLVIFSASLIYAAVYLYNKWEIITHRDDSPLQQAKRAWQKAKKGSKKDDLEVDLDLMIVEGMNRANDFCTLCNMYEEGITYSFTFLFFFKFKKHREITPIICAGYSNRYEKIKTKMEEAKKEKEEERRKHKDDDRAPRPQRIERRGQHRSPDVCNMAFLRKSDTGATLH